MTRPDIRRIGPAAALLAALGVGPAAARANGFAHSPEYIRRVNREAFRGCRPEEIARYLAHFSGGVAEGAVAALAEGGEKNLPLIRRLLKDTNPWIRGGAVRVLTAIYAPPAEGGSEAPPQMTPRLQAAVDLVKPLLDDPHPDVQGAVGGFFRRLRVENEFVRKVVVAQASDPDPAIRGRTAMAMRSWIRDPQTRVRVGMAVLADPAGVDPHALSRASILLWEHKELARPAIPVVVRYLNNRAHTVRGFFTNGPYQRGLALIEHYLDSDLERMPGLVQAVCRAVVRIPYSTYGGWMDARKRAVAILERLSPFSAPAVRAAADEEARWAASVGDDELQAVCPAEGKRDSTRAECLKRIAWLRALAAWLAAGKPPDGKPAFVHPQPKPRRPKKAQKKPPAKKPAGAAPSFPTVPSAFQKDR